MDEVYSDNDEVTFFLPNPLFSSQGHSIIGRKKADLGERIDIMKTFDYSKLADRTWDNEIVSYLTQIHEFKGKQELYIKQKPIELERLIEIAKIQSTEASNRIEGIVTTNARLKQLVENKTTPRNRDEAEILGYRNALNIVHESHEYILFLLTIYCSYMENSLSTPLFLMVGNLKLPQMKLPKHCQMEQKRLSSLH